jgi:serine/threonine protein kinase
MLKSNSKAKSLDTSAGRCTVVSTNYEKIGRVGRGTYGVVYKARCKRSNKVVALKRCIPYYESSDGFPLTTLREIYALRMCASHPNIVQWNEIAVSTHGVFLVLEYCQYDLANVIDEYFQKHEMSPFSQAAVKTLSTQLLSAVAYIHAQQLIHRDIKLSNLLLTSAGVLKVADFGLSRVYSEDVNLTLNVASLWYRPMELLLGATSYTQAIDLWAVGCSICELLAGTPPMSGRDETSQIKSIVDF